MLFKPLFLACAFIALISAYRPTLQNESQDKPIVIDGKTEIVASCPVSLSDAKYIFYGLPGQRMKKEKYAIDFRFSLPGRDQAGVALFIAEAKLPDGTTWKQKLTREDLMWSEVAN